MSKTITDYTAAGSIDTSNDYLLIEQSGVYKKINRTVLLGITGSPVGTSDSQVLTNKTIGNTNTVTIKDTLFTLQDDGDATKLIAFQLSGITTGSTRTLTVPDASLTIVGTATTQTLTNKTLTAPAITGGTIDNSTITVDSIAGHTAGTTGTIYGMSVSGGVINNTSIATNGVSGANLATTAIGLGYAQITSAFTSTTTPGYTDITGLAVTVTVPAGNRNLKITVFGSKVKSSQAAGNTVAVAIVEGSTVLQAGAYDTPVTSYSEIMNVVAYVAAPSAGNHTYKAQFSQSAAGTFTMAGATAPTASNGGPSFILVELI